MLVCGKSALEQKTFDLSMAYYVRILVQEAAVNMVHYIKSYYNINKEIMINDFKLCVVLFIIFNENIFLITDLDFPVILNGSLLAEDNLLNI